MAGLGVRFNSYRYAENNHNHRHPSGVTSVSFNSFGTLKTKDLLQELDTENVSIPFRYAENTIQDV